MSLLNIVLTFSGIFVYWMTSSSSYILRHPWLSKNRGKDLTSFIYWIPDILFWVLPLLKLKWRIDFITVIRGFVHSFMLYNMRLMQIRFWKIVHWDFKWFTGYWFDFLWFSFSDQREIINFSLLLWDTHFKLSSRWNCSSCWNSSLCCKGE